MPGYYNKKKRFSNYTRKPKRNNFKMYQNVVVKNEELKYLDVNFTSQDPTTTGTVYQINNIAEGSEFNQRDGRNIRIKYVDVKMWWDWPAAANAPTAPVSARCALVLDRQPNGTAATYGQIFDISVASPTFAMKNVADNQYRFKILKDDLMTFYTGYAQDPLLDYFIKIPFSKSPKDSIVRYPGTTATVPNTNALYIVTCSSELAPSQTTINGVVRVAYVDM